MHKIVCLHLEKEKINQVILDECSQHSPLVEPRGEQGVLLDLSTFKRAGEIVKGAPLPTFTRCLRKIGRVSPFSRYAPGRGGNQRCSSD